MWEKCKLAILLLLIGLSLLQTYLLWFGQPLPQEGILPRYERVFFTDPPPVSRFVQPAQIVAQHGNERYLFGRGEETYHRLWEKCFELLASTGQRPGMEMVAPEEIQYLEEIETRLVCRFSYPLPPEVFFSEVSLNPEVEVITLHWENQDLHILLEGEDVFLYRVPAVLARDILEVLTEAGGATYAYLPAELELYAVDRDGPEPELLLLPAGSVNVFDEGETELESVTTGTGQAGQSAREEDPENGERDPEEDTEENDPLKTPEAIDDLLEEDLGEEDLGGEAVEGEHEGVEEEILSPERPAVEAPEQLEDRPERVWHIQVKGDILVPEINLWAAARSLEQEEIELDQLVRAFFIDTTMARRIEERDDALYFTDGERGLRIYSSGLVEYTAPKLERVLSRIHYFTALQKGSENLSLFGGWKPEAYLDKVERQNVGYSLTWQLYYRGLRLAGDQIGCAMIVNEQGVPYYQRKFPVIGEALFEKTPFRSYENALYHAIMLAPEAFPDNRVTLLSLEPVYFIPGEGQHEKAIPAWNIHLQEAGPVYLHWETLEPLH